MKSIQEFIQLGELVRGPSGALSRTRDLEKEDHIRQYTREAWYHQRDQTTAMVSLNLTAHAILQRPCRSSYANQVNQKRTCECHALVYDYVSAVFPHPIRFIYENMLRIGAVYDMIGEEVDSYLGLSLQTLGAELTESAFLEFIERQHPIFQQGLRHLATMLMHCLKLYSKGYGPNRETPRFTAIELHTARFHARFADKAEKTAIKFTLNNGLARPIMHRAAIIKELLRINFAALGMSAKQRSVYVFTSPIRQFASISDGMNDPQTPIPGMWSTPRWGSPLAALYHWDLLIMPDEPEKEAPLIIGLINTNSGIDFDTTLEMPVLPAFKSWQRIGCCKMSKPLLKNWMLPFDEL